MSKEQPDNTNRFQKTLKQVGETIRTIDRRLLFFLIFVALSALLWLLNALSKDYITEIECPIEFYNIPDDYVLVEDVPSHINLQVSGRGFTLIKYSIGSIALPFNLDLQSYFSVNQEQEKSVQFQYYVSSKKEQIERFLNDEIKVLSVTPATMMLRFDKLHEKTFKVKPVTNLSWAPQYRQKGEPETKPDSVIVLGPKSVLDTLKNIKTKTIEADNIQTDQTYKARLITPEQCNLTQKKVTVRIKTEQFTENTVQVPIKITNKPDSVALKIFPNQIKVTYLVSFEDYSAIKPSDFKAAIDFKEINNQNSPQELQVNLLYVPEGARVLKFWPHKARFIINEN